MKNLINKEFKLVIVVWAYIMPLLGALLLLPNWLYFLALMYVFITIPTTLIVAKDQRDIDFSILLPVRKKDIVKARYISIITIEMVQIAIAVIFAIISNRISPYGNAWLLDLNPAFFGFVFIMYALFNSIFLTMYYKSGFKIALPISIALVATIVYAVFVEYIVQSVPLLKTNLDTLSKDMMPVQLLVLLAGILVFIVSMVLSCRISARNFEKIDL